MHSVAVNTLNLEQFDLSSVLKRDAQLDLHRRLQPVSLVVADRLGRVVFGHSWIKEHCGESVMLQRLDLDETESWLLNYNLLNSFGLAGLFEQLNVWRQLSVRMTLDEMRKVIQFPFPLDQDVQARLPDVFSGPFRENLEKDEIVWQVLFRLLKRESEEWPYWSRLFSIARLSRSRQIAILEALEEVLFRDKGSVSELVDSLTSGNNAASDKGEGIWNRLFRLRYPQTSTLEDRFETQVKELNLPAGFTVKHAPFFDSSQVEFSARFADLPSFVRFWTDSK